MYPETATRIRASRPYYIAWKAIIKLEKENSSESLISPLESIDLLPDLAG